MNPLFKTCIYPIAPQHTLNTMDLTDVYITIDDDAFKLPEGELIGDIETRNLTPHVPEPTVQQVPTYLSACLYDEFSRDFSSISVAELSPSHVPLVSYPDVIEVVGVPTFPEEGLMIAASNNSSSNSSSSSRGIGKRKGSFSSTGSGGSSGVASVAVPVGRRFLQHYHPCYPPGWPSTFKHSPPDSRHLLAPGPKTLATDTHLLFELAPTLSVKLEFEPLFGHLALYMFEGDRCVRISESFHFSCTSPTVRERYRDVYRFSEDDLLPEERRELPDVFFPTVHCMLTLPEDVRRRDVFLVVQVTKVLSEDAFFNPLSRPDPSPPPRSLTPHPLPRPDPSPRCSRGTRRRRCSRTNARRHRPRKSPNTWTRAGGSTTSASQWGSACFGCSTASTPADASCPSSCPFTRSRRRWARPRWGTPSETCTRPTAPPRTRAWSCWT